MTKIKYQRLEIVYPAGTTAGVKRDNEIVLDPEMSKAVAVAMYPIATGGVNAVRLGLKDSSGEIQEPTHQDDFIDKGHGNYYERKKPLDIVAGGRKLYVAVDIPEALTETLSFDLVFVLKND